MSSLRPSKLGKERRPTSEEMSLLVPHLLAQLCEELRELDIVIAELEHLQYQRLYGAPRKLSVMKKSSPKRMAAPSGF